MASCDRRVKSAIYRRPKVPSNRAIKSAPTRRKSKKYKMESIIDKVKNIEIHRESGGTWDIENGIINLQYAGIAKTVHNREAFLIMAKNLNSTPQWHSHPFMSGWYPSAEDIMRVNVRPHILLTRYGIWIMYKIQHISSQWPGVEMQILGDRLHSLQLHVLQTRDHEEFFKRFQVAKKWISQYIDYIHGYGKVLKFFPFDEPSYLKNAEAFAKRKYWNSLT